MVWIPKANLRGVPGYNAIGAAEDIQALADYTKETAGPNAFSTAQKAQAKAVAAAEILTPGTATNTGLAATFARTPNVAPNGAGYGGGLAIHYDDGFRTDYTRALPVHRELGIPGISHVISGYIDNGPPAGQAPRITWAQARELRDSGLWSIGNHTKDHPTLSNNTVTVIREQVEGCYARILAEMGEPPLWFAPPFHAVNKNVEIITSRLHARARSTVSAAAAQGGYTFTQSTVQAWDAQRFPTGLTALPALLNDLYYKTVVRGEVVHIYMHEITDTHVDTGFANVGAAEHRALLEGIRSRNIPVFDPRALAYPRLNMLDDSSFEQGGKGWTFNTNNGTASVLTGQGLDAHSGNSFLRFANLGAAGGGPNAQHHYVGLPTHVTREWRFTCWVRPSRVSGGAFRVDVRKANGMQGLATVSTTLTSGAAAGQTIAGAGWQKFSALIDMTGFSEARLYMEGRSTDGAAVNIDVDSMSLTPSFAFDINGETAA